MLINTQTHGKLFYTHTHTHTHTHTPLNVLVGEVNVGSFVM